MGLDEFVVGDVEDFFRIGRKLGEGGFAKVYLGVEKTTGTQRALKFFHVDKATADVENECRCVRDAAAVDCDATPPHSGHHAGISTAPLDPVL